MGLEALGWLPWCLGGVRDNAEFALAASACPLPCGGSDTALSTPAIDVLCPGNPHCNSVSVDGGDESAARNPSANTADSADAELASAS